MIAHIKFWLHRLQLKAALRRKKRLHAQMLHDHVTGPALWQVHGEVWTLYKQIYK